MNSAFSWIAFLCLGSTPPAQSAERALAADRQDPPAKDQDKQELEKLRKEVESLRKELDELKKKKQEPGAKEEDLDALEERIEKRLKQIDERLESINRTAAKNALNPSLTAFFNGVWRMDDDHAFARNAAVPPQAIDDRPFLRTAELEFKAAVDPYADATIILSLEGQPDGSFGVDVEEAFVVLKRLPILESAPAGVVLKLGKFRIPFGIMNITHLHDMPWTTRPLPVALYLGTENGEFFESGLAVPGAETSLILPTIVSGVTTTFTADFVEAGKSGLTAGNDPWQPAFSGHLSNFFVVASGHTINFGGSIYAEQGRFDVQLYGVDLLYKWKPVEQGEWHSLVVGGELYVAQREFPDPATGLLARSHPLGLYVFAQYQIDFPVYIGFRYDYAQDPANMRTETRVYAGYLTYYTSEFLRFRLGVEHRESDHPVEDGLNTVFIEVNVVIGSHPVEPFWVNK